jgi:hypothetical protein
MIQEEDAASEEFRTLKQPRARMNAWTKYSWLQLVIFVHSLLRVLWHLILWVRPMYFRSGPLTVFYESVCEEESPTRACFGHPYQGGQKSLPLLLIYSHPAVIRMWVLFGRKKGGDVVPNQPPHPYRAVLGSFCLQTLIDHNFCIRTLFLTCDLSNCLESKVISEISQWCFWHLWMAFL